MTSNNIYNKNINPSTAPPSDDNIVFYDGMSDEELDVLLKATLAEDSATSEQKKLSAATSASDSSTTTSADHQSQKDQRHGHRPNSAVNDLAEVTADAQDPASATTDTTLDLDFEVGEFPDFQSLATPYASTPAASLDLEEHFFDFKEDISVLDDHLLKDSELSNTPPAKAKEANDKPSKVPNKIVASKDTDSKLSAPSTVDVNESPDTKQEPDHTAPSPFSESPEIQQVSQQIASDLLQLKTHMHLLTLQFHELGNLSSRLMSQLRQLQSGSADDFSITYEQMHELRRQLVTTKQQAGTMPSLLDLVEEALESELFVAQTRKKR